MSKKEAREKAKETRKIVKEILKLLEKTGHTVSELSQKLSIDSEKIEYCISRLKESKQHLAGGNIINWRPHNGNMVYLYVPKEKKKSIVSDRAFIFLPTSDGLGERGFYHRVIIPDDVLGLNNKPAKDIEITPFYDIHYGHNRCDLDLFRFDIEEVRRRPNRFALFGGDSLENALSDSAGGIAWAEQNMTPDEQRIGFEEEIGSVAHKTLVMIPGNHEHRTTRKTLMCPLREVSRFLGIPYFMGPVLLDLTWRSFRWTFFLSHGRSGSNTPGGKLNAVGKARQFILADFFIMGHVHDKKSHSVSRLVPRREFQNGKLVRFRIEKKIERKIICPSYLMYKGTYAQQAGYVPGSCGSILIKLNADGTASVKTGSRTSTGDVKGIIV
ncbi:MAG: hypothetical protein L3J07_02030 [Candidatus Magasanikbacteria bacterium]|nr:hypothetical protein [Candidatus Magasanikbacteria bacterium]